MPKLIPLVDRNKCEAKTSCVEVCPYTVFEVQSLTAEHKSALSIKGRIKAWVHGNQQAFAVRADHCHVCRKCVTACPESAISLVEAVP